MNDDKTEKEPVDRQVSNSESSKEPIHGPNPELYEEMRIPFSNKESANSAMGTFLRGVQDLRKACKIPEVLIIASCNFKPEKEETTTIQALSLGHHEMRAELAALAYQQYAMPEIARAERLQQIAQGTLGKPVRARKQNKTSKK